MLEGSIRHLKGVECVLSPLFYFDILLANNVDPDQTPNLGMHCVLLTPFLGFLWVKVKYSPCSAL